jgi:hypothetical protein
MRTAQSRRTTRSPVWPFNPGIRVCAISFRRRASPTGEYHYHGVSELLADAYASGHDLPTESRVGSDCAGSDALQGVAVEVAGRTPDGTYTSDWVYSDDRGDLDECNGVEVDGTPT